MQAFVRKSPIISATILVWLLSLATYIPLSIPFGNVSIRLILCVIIILYIRKSNLTNVLQFNLSSFARGLVSGILVFLFAVWVAVNNIIALSSQFHLSVAFWDFCIRMLMIGIFEELCYRGLILNICIKNREKTRSTVYKAVLLSSLLFGIIHYTNLIKQPFLNTTVQVLSAVCIGIFFAAVYLKNMNIWVCAFIHALWDFANLYGSFLSIQNSNAVEKMTLSQAALSMVEPIIFLLIGLFVLRNIHKEKYMNAIAISYKQ